MGETNRGGKRIKLLVCFIHAHMGGAMTSLVNFLNALDTDKYDVDVMFYENGPSRYGIKEEINILPQGKIHKPLGFKNIVRKIFSPRYLIALVRERYYRYIKRNKPRAVQIISKEGCWFSRRLDSEYDIAIAYEFNWCLNYVMKRVKAKKKILWHHVEFEKSGLDFKTDKKSFDDADALVFVSRDLMEEYAKLHPEHRDKARFIPNILSSDFVRKKGEGEAELPFEDAPNYIKLLSVARIKFGQKGLDRAAYAFSRLKREGLLDNVKWIVAGGGSDLARFEKIIEEEGLTEHIYPIGAKENPIPYMKKCDAFFLPSIYEGKPMAVTEGFIMGLPPIVTRYASAGEQIRDGIDGIIFENDLEALYMGLKKLFQSPEILKELKRNVRATEYGNEKDIAEFDKLAAELL